MQIPPETQVVIDFDDNRAASALVGPYGQNLALVERRLGVVVDSRGNHITIAGSRDGCDAARRVLETLYSQAVQGHDLSQGEVEGAIRVVLAQGSLFEFDPKTGTVRWKTDLMFPLGSDAMNSNPELMDAMKKFAEIVNSPDAAGFDVAIKVVDDVARVEGRNRVPEELRTCHVAFVGPYVVEGHVPADVIKDLLRRRPAIDGIAVPGMPKGSPGMESPTPEPYDVIAFDKKGTTTTFARR
jgi:hypothetical protein